MIRSLRARHRAIFVLLALCLPAGFGAALAGRRAQAPAATHGAQVGFEEIGGPTRTVTWSDHALLTHIRHSADGRLGVRLSTWVEPTAPALLLYWSSAQPLDDALPLDARLLGPLGSAAAAPREFVLASVGAGGWLVLYSLGHSQVESALELAALEDS